MSYLKFNAAHLFTGTEMLNSNYVLITNEQGVVQDIIQKKDVSDGIQYFEGILSPGFVNCHCHLELSHMKGLIPEKTGLVDFVFKVITGRHFDENEILEAIIKAEDEMHAVGIVAVGDICNNTFTLPQKLNKRLTYYNFIEVSGWLPQIAKQRLQRSKAHYDEFVNGQWSMVNKGEEQNERTLQSTGNWQPATGDVLPKQTGRQLQTALVPHAPYSVSEELWNLLQPFFINNTISIHNQETSFEDELFIQNKGDFLRMYQLMKIDNSFFKPTGKSSLQSYFNKMRNAKNVVLVHNTVTTEKDVEFANQQSQICEQQLFWCLCANANLYIEEKIPPVDMLLKNNCTIVLGTDSLASNWSLNLLDEMKIIQKYFPGVAAEQLLQWATINGAQALQMDKFLGSFEKGKKPGVVLIENLEQRKLIGQSTVRRLI